MVDGKPGRPVVDGETKTWQMLIPMEPSYQDPIKLASAQEGRSQAGWVRHRILTGLQELGLVDETFQVKAS
jgi:hypothetical protein